MKKQISVPNAPAAIGPYSQAIETETAVYVSGQIPLDPATGSLAEGGIKEQTDRAIKNVAAVLAGAGLGLGDVVKTTVLLADMGDFAAMNEVYARYFTEPFPARAAFEVSALPRGARVEIEAVATK